MIDFFISGGSVRKHCDLAVGRGKGGGQVQMARLVITLLLVSIALLAGGANAGERTGPIRIGQLTESWGPTPAMAGLRDGLLELGYRENEDFVIGVRFTQGDRGALPAAARELVKLGVDLIFLTGIHTAKAARMATSKIPIVFAGAIGYPMALGLIQSFAQPGGNVTGVTDLDLELGPKRLEIFKELLPGLKRVLFTYDPSDPYTMAVAIAYREAARRLGIVLVEKAVRSQAEAQATLADVRKSDLDGILAPSVISMNIPGTILQAASQRGIPSMFGQSFWVEQGGLASYGPDYYASGRQAARLVDKILKGEDPANIPVEANPNIEFAINLKTAEALGLTVAPAMLYRADRVFR
jgi:putative ABC transport system substrate-binding protein